MEKPEPTKEKAQIEETRFSKKQWLQSKQFADYRDLLQVILEEKSYTKTEVNKRIQDFLEKEVK